MIDMLTAGAVPLIVIFGGLALVDWALERLER
jgi:hypothetical protein